MAASIYPSRQLILILALLSLPTSTLGFLTPSIATPTIKGASTIKDVRIPVVFKSQPLFISTPSRNSGINERSKLKPLSFAKMRQISNVASFLCLLDCTLLPIVTVALPLLGVLNLDAAQIEWIHQLGHSLALCFVLPVGCMTTVVNYLSHKRAWIASLASLGLALVGLANSSHFHHVPGLGQHVEFLYAIQHGSLHRIVNVMGCGLLLGSNYLSQQLGCECCPTPGSSSSSSGGESNTRSVPMSSMARSMQYRQYVTEVRATKTMDKS